MSDFESESRQEARACGRMGVAAFSLAFNTKSDPNWEWRYSSEVRSRVDELCAEMVKLLETAAIEPTPGNALLVASREARKDPALQTLLLKASRKTPIRGLQRSKTKLPDASRTL
jgi:hypothetical protein